MIRVLGLSVLPIAIGLYLPIHLSVPIWIGGLIKWYLEKRKASKETIERGTLYSSGLIAGEGIVGILLAVFAIIPVGGRTLGDVINVGGILGNTGGMIFFILLVASLIVFTVRKNKKAQ